MGLIEHQDKQEAIDVIDEALKIQLKLINGKTLDVLLGRLYEEKGHLLKNIAETCTDPKDEEQKINVKTRALQCFNSAHGIFRQLND